MTILLAAMAVMLIGVIVGMALRGTVLVGDKRAVDRISERLVAELRMEARTQATMHAMQRAAAEARTKANGGASR